MKAVSQMDSCPGRSWLALTPMHRGAPLASLYLTEGGYGSAGTLGSIQKFITPLCFYYCLLCSSGEAVKFSSISAPVLDVCSLEEMGCQSILPQCRSWEVLCSSKPCLCSPFTFALSSGACFCEFPSSPSPNSRHVVVELQVGSCLRACGDGAVLPVRGTHCL